MKHATIFVLIIIFNFVASTPIHVCKNKISKKLHNSYTGRIFDKLFALNYSLRDKQVIESGSSRFAFKFCLQLFLIIQRLVTHSLFYQFVNWCQSLHTEIFFLFSLNFTFVSTHKENHHYLIELDRGTFNWLTRHFILLTQTKLL